MNHHIHRQPPVREVPKWPYHDIAEISITAPHGNSQAGAASRGLPTAGGTAPWQQRGQLGNLGSNRPMRCSKFHFLEAHAHTGLGMWSWFCIPCSVNGFRKVFCTIHGQNFSYVSLTNDTSDSSKSSVDVWATHKPNLLLRSLQTQWFVLREGITLYTTDCVSTAHVSQQLLPFLSEFSLEGFFPLFMAIFS